jgi:methyl-accepting chemotaxis protein
LDCCTCEYPGHTSGQAIAQNVRQAANGTEAVSVGVTYVSRAAATAGASAREALSNARDLSGAAMTLRIEVDRFIRQIHAA